MPCWADSEMQDQKENLKTLLLTFRSPTVDRPQRLGDPVHFGLSKDPRIAGPPDRSNRPRANGVRNPIPAVAKLNSNVPNRKQRRICPNHENISACLLSVPLYFTTCCVEEKAPKTRRNTGETRSPVNSRRSPRGEDSTTNQALRLAMGTSTVKAGRSVEETTRVGRSGEETSLDRSTTRSSPTC